MPRKYEYALWALLGFGVLAAGFTAAGFARSKAPSAENVELYRQLDLFGQVLQHVRADYVEKPDDSKLIEDAINGMWRLSTRTPPISIQKTSGTCRSKRAASSAASVSR